MATTSPPTKQIALITGANRGIGFTLARTLARDHNFHILLGSRNPESGVSAAQILLSEGLSVEPITIDLASDTSISSAAATIKQKHGHIDVLVNNAGVLFDPEPGPRRPLFHKTFDTNVFGAYAVTEAFAPLLEASPQANAPPRIVFLSSRLGSVSDRLDPGSPYEGVNSVIYRASKSALNMVGANFAWRYRDKGWKVNVVCPGWVATDINGGKGALSTEEAMPNLVRLCTLGVEGESGTYTDPEGYLGW
jgi:NAD(P)-dependent dehydrogenase (short-subunit alcohol dehydrogenase family)